VLPLVRHPRRLRRLASKNVSGGLDMFDSLWDEYSSLNPATNKLWTMVEGISGFSSRFTEKSIQHAGEFVWEVAAKAPKSPRAC
jgi:hypothetical protein